VAALQTRAGGAETGPKPDAATQTEVCATGGESAQSQSAAEANADQPFIDHGPPVPERYDIDIIRAMVQDPFRVFVYWEISEQSIKTLAHYFSAEQEEAFQITLKLIEIDRPEETSFDVDTQGSYWMMARPDREYEFEMGVRSSRRGYIPLMRSNRVHTPNETISRVAPNEAEYRLSPQQFAEVLEASGFAGNHALQFSAGSVLAAPPQIQDQHPFPLAPASRTLGSLISFTLGGRDAHASGRL
jgi:hypothetical protein